MRILVAVLSLALFFSLGGTLFAEKDPPAVLLERGIFLEQTLGDIEGAMVIYQKILDREDAGKRHSAEASFRLAACLAKRGSYAQATRHYLRVVKNFGEFKGLAERAGKQVVEISQALALEGAVMEADDVAYFGDLMYALSASLSYEDLALTSDVIAEAQRMAKLLAGQVEGSDDEVLFTDCLQVLSELSKLVEGGRRLEATDRFDESDELDYFMYREPLIESIDVFEPALGWKDKIAEGLTAEKSGKAEKFANRIVGYLEPLESLPEDDDEKQFVLTLLAQARAIGEKIEEDPAGAVALLFKYDKERWETTGVMSLVLGGAEILPLTELPRFSLFYAYSIQASQLIMGGDDVMARGAIHNAIGTVDEIAASKGLDRDAKEMLNELRDGLKSALVALELGDREEAIEAIGVETLNLEMEGE